MVISEAERRVVVFTPCKDGWCELTLFTREDTSSEWKQKRLRLTVDELATIPTVRVELRNS